MVGNNMLGISENDYKRGRIIGLSTRIVYQRVLQGWDIELAVTTPKYKKRRTQEYMLYKNEDLLCIGTAQELADYLGNSVDTIYYYVSSKRQDKKNNGYFVYRMDDDE